MCPVSDDNYFSMQANQGFLSVDSGFVVYVIVVNIVICCITEHLCTCFGALQ